MRPTIGQLALAVATLGPLTVAGCSSTVDVDISAPKVTGDTFAVEIDNGEAEPIYISQVAAGINLPESATEVRRFQHEALARGKSKLVFSVSVFSNMPDDQIVRSAQTGKIPGSFDITLSNSTGGRGRRLSWNMTPEQVQQILLAHVERCSKLASHSAEAHCISFNEMVNMPAAHPMPINN